MAKLKKDELLAELKTYTGERTDDETLKLIEDVSDSIDADGDGKADIDELQKKYDDLAKKYKDRFTDPAPAEEEKTEEKEEVEEDPTIDEMGDGVKIEDLFEDEKKEGK